jgi:hypothetical protein
MTNKNEKTKKQKWQKKNLNNKYFDLIFEVYFNVFINRGVNIEVRIKSRQVENKRYIFKNKRDTINTLRMYDIIWEYTKT